MRLSRRSASMVDRAKLIPPPQERAALLREAFEKVAWVSGELALILQTKRGLTATALMVYQNKLNEARLNLQRILD